jgi:outer membrane lipoprotein SlyB
MTDGNANRKAELLKTKMTIMKRILGVLAMAAVMMTATVTETKAQGYYTEVQQRPAWSQRATGAVVGAGGGAVLGAVINRRDPGQGAAIGAVLGAGIGYLVGQNEDRMHPRGNVVRTKTVYNEYGQVVDQSRQRVYRDQPRYGKRGYYNNRNNNNYNNGYNRNNYNAGYRYR